MFLFLQVLATLDVDLFIMPEYDGFIPNPVSFAAVDPPL